MAARRTPQARSLQITSPAQTDGTGRTLILIGILRFGRCRGGIAEDLHSPAAANRQNRNNATAKRVIEDHPTTIAKDL